MRFGKSLVLGSVLGVIGMSAWASAGTIAQFNFDSSSDGGTTFSDISGNGHDLTFNRPVKLQDENPFGGKDAKDKSIVIEDNKGSNVTNSTVADANKIDLAKTRDFTIEAWVNASALPEGKNVARVIQMESKDGGTTNIFLGIDHEGKVIARVYANGGGSKIFSGDAKVELNKWSHLALVYDSGTATVYVDGKKDVSQHIGRPLPKSLKRVSIGSHFTGAIDDVLISDEALSGDQLGLKKSFTGEGQAASKPAADEAGEKK